MAKPEESKEVVWSKELEERLHYVETCYDGARNRGVDIVKILLGTAVVIAGAPIIFYDKVLMVFKSSMGLIYWSWIMMLLSIATGFLTQFFVFEGYFNHAHRESCRWLGHNNQNNKGDIAKYSLISNRYFDFAHASAIVLMFFFVCSLSLVCLAIFKNASGDKYFMTALEQFCCGA